MNPRAVAQSRESGAWSGRPRPEPDPFASLTPKDGTPYPHLDWVPCVEGCCLAWDGADKSRAAERWLAYLIDHFLRPGALAHLDGRPDFDGFTFDHLVNGTIAAYRNDTRELFLIHCDDNAISTEQLIPPDPDVWTC
ncbi:hypothetical protein GCM10027053_08670 [Intrasporangium mesophilum]